MTEQNEPYRKQENPRTTLGTQLKESKEIIAALTLIAVTVLGVINFVATKQDIKRLSCKIDIQFKVTQATSQKREEEQVLKNLNKEANILEIQKRSGTVTLDEFNFRHPQVIQDQKEAQRKIEDLQKIVDEGAPMRVATSCDK